MKKRILVVLATLASAMIATPIRAQQPDTPPPAGRRPNIVLIMADDMGFSDLGCYGGEIRTPNLDRLARQGVRFTQFYNTPRCCPSRASLLTGVYPHQAGVGAMNQDLGVPAYQGHLNDRVVTMAEVLRAGGYRTAMVGKWHLSGINISHSPDAKAMLSFRKDAPVSDEEDQKTWPHRRGFDDFVGTVPGVGSFFDPYGLVHNDETIKPPAGFYYTDFINDAAVERILEFGKADRPFFLYVAHTAPHWPLHAKERDIAAYREVYASGWGEIRAARDRRLREMGLIDSRWPLSPVADSVADSPDRPIAWSKVRNAQWEVERMATYAAQVDALDQGVGRIMRAIEEVGRADDTLVVFLADNGACAEVVRRDWYDVVTQTRDGREIRVGNDPSIMPGPELSYQSYGPIWANVSNTPFRGYKHHTYEGGISTPFIMRWPGGIARPGAIVRQVGQLIDLMPTFVEASGATYPTAFNGKVIQPMEGRSLLPLLGNDPPAKRPPIFWEHEGNRAVRDGKWKLVADHGRPWSLYDMEADRTETLDLAQEKPEITERLIAEYEAWAKRAGVRPWPVRK